MARRNSMFRSSAALLTVLGYAIPLFSQTVIRSSDSLFLSGGSTPTATTVPSSDCFTITGDPGRHAALSQELLSAVKQATLALAVDRVVTDAASTNQDGSLKNADQLIANGVVSRCQNLQVTTDDASPIAYGYKVYVNGTHVGTVPASTKAANELCVNPGMLKFGVRQGTGTSPTHGVNTITLQMDAR